MRRVAVSEDIGLDHVKDAVTLKIKLHLLQNSSKKSILVYFIDTKSSNYSDAQIIFSPG